MSGAGYGRARANARVREDADRMCRRPWLESREAGRQGAQDAKRISSFVYSMAMQNRTVGVVEVANLLAHSRDYQTTRHGDSRPTKDEIQRARYALETLAKTNKALRRYIDYHITEEAHHEPQQS